MMNLIKAHSRKYDPDISQIVILAYFGCTIDEIQSALQSGRLRYVRAMIAYVLFIHTKLTTTQIALRFKIARNTLHQMASAKAIDVANGRRNESKDIKNILNILKQNQCQI